MSGLYSQIKLSLEEVCALLDKGHYQFLQDAIKNDCIQDLEHGLGIILYVRWCHKTSYRGIDKIADPYTSKVGTAVIAKFLDKKYQGYAEISLEIKLAEPKKVMYLAKHLDIDKHKFLANAILQRFLKTYYVTDILCHGMNTMAISQPTYLSPLAAGPPTFTPPPPIRDMEREVEIATDAFMSLVEFADLHHHWQRMRSGNTYLAAVACGDLKRGLTDHGIRFGINRSHALFLGIINHVEQEANAKIQINHVPVTALRNIL